jgi:hypothetical protein
MVLTESRRRRHRNAGRWRRGLAYAEVDAMDAELFQGLRRRCPVTNCPRVAVTYQINSFLKELCGEKTAKG